MTQLRRRRRSKNWAKECAALDRNDAARRLSVRPYVLSLGRMRPLHRKESRSGLYSRVRLRRSGAALIWVQGFVEWSLGSARPRDAREASFSFLLHPSFFLVHAQTPRRPRPVTAACGQTAASATATAVRPSKSEGGERGNESIRLPPRPLASS